MGISCLNCLNGKIQVYNHQPNINLSELNPLETHQIQALQHKKSKPQDQSTYKGKDIEVKNYINPQSQLTCILFQSPQVIINPQAKQIFIQQKPPQLLNRTTKHKAQGRQTKQFIKADLQQNSTKSINQCNFPSNQINSQHIKSNKSIELFSIQSNSINSQYIQKKIQKILKQSELQIFHQQNKGSQQIIKLVKNIQNKYKSQQRQLDVAYLQSLIVNLQIEEGKDITTIFKHYKKAIKIYSRYQTNYFQQIITLQNNMALYAFNSPSKTKKYQALSLLRKSLRMLQKYVNIKDQRMLLVYSNMANCYCEMGIYLKGMIYFDKCSQFKGHVNDELILAIQNNRLFYEKQQAKLHPSDMINLMTKSNLASKIQTDKDDNKQKNKNLFRSALNDRTKPRDIDSNIQDKIHNTCIQPQQLLQHQPFQINYNLDVIQNGN